MVSPYIYRDRLETERLSTRFLKADDYLLWVEFFNEKEAIKFLPTFGLTSALDKAKYWIERQLRRYEKEQFGLQALIHKGTEAFIGQCGLVKQEVGGQLEIEVGYHILRKYWGNGFATEASRVFIDYAFQNNLTNSIISIIDVGNVKSQKVAEKNGFAREKQIKWSDSDVYIYRLWRNGTKLSPEEI